jgi:nucleoside diphosphate kinase
MSLSINKKAYTELIEQDLKLLNKNCKDSPELDHIRLVLCNSIDMHYPERKSAHDVYTTAKEQNLSDQQFKELLVKEGIVVKKLLSRTKIIAHYKTFMGTQDMGLAEGDNLTIDWAESLIEDFLSTKR